MAKKHKKNKKWISWVILLILFLAASVVAYLVWDSYFNDKTDEIDEQETEQVEDTEEVIDGDEEIEIIEKQKVEQYDGKDPNEAEVLSGAVTYAGVNGDSLMIRVNIDQYLNSGECDLSLEKGGTVIYNEAARVVDSASTATCEGFDVPISELGSGLFTISINIRAGDKVGTISSEVDI